MVGLLEKQDIDILRSYIPRQTQSIQSKDSSLPQIKEELRPLILASRGIVFSICHSFDLNLAKEVQVIIFGIIEQIEKSPSLPALDQWIINNYQQLNKMLQDRILEHYSENTSEEDLQELRKNYGKHLSDIENDESYTSEVRIK